MIIRSLLIHNLRNHEHTEIELSPGVNIFYGLNGAGKTSVLESVSIAGLSKSFLPVPDAALVRQNEENYLVSLRADTDHGVPYKVSLQYTPGAKKLISSTAGDNLNPKDIIGELPLVILSPDFKNITFGSPADRRQFLDSVLSQASKRYVEEAIQLKRILKQRNSLLNAAKIQRNMNKAVMDAWTDAFIKSASEIVVRRSAFIEEFVPFFKTAYEDVAGTHEPVGIEYTPDSIDAELLKHDGEEVLKTELLKESVAKRFREIAIQMWPEELRRGTTLFGPQKDDVRIEINGGVAKEFASQGQHKSLLISIKFAEFEFLRNRKGENPVILLDDIFAELDTKRTEKVFSNVIVSAAQTLITTTDAERLQDILPREIPTAVFRVSGGIVFREA
ncbi:MAG: DNA replication and repair protein RecF [Bacteroidota bacterium]